MIKYPRLKDSEKEIKLSEFGYISIPAFLNQEDLDALTVLFKKYQAVNNISEGFFHSVQHLESGSAKEFSLLAADIIRPRVDEYFEDAYVPIVTFLDKLPNKASHLGAHRDGSVLDETKYRYRNLWMPLVDINQDNGALFVLPKSHRYFTNTTPVGAHWPYEKYWDIINKHVITVYPQKGDLVIYDQDMIHGSWQNRSSQSRPVVMTGLLHKDYELLYYKVESEQEETIIIAYKVEPDFYLNSTNFESVREEDIVFRKSIINEDYSVEAFEALLDTISRS